MRGAIARRVPRPGEAKRGDRAARGAIACREGAGSWGRARPVVASRGAFVAAGPVYRFEPEGLTFAQPITVAFPAPSDGSSAMAFWSTGDGSTFDVLPASHVGSTIVVHPSHFSGGGVGWYGGTAGPLGATIHAGLLTLTFPPGAVSSEQTIQVRAGSDDDAAWLAWLFDGVTPSTSRSQDRESWYFDVRPHGLTVVKPVTAAIETWPAGLPPEHNYVAGSYDGRGWIDWENTTVLHPGTPNLGLTAGVSTFGSFLTAMHECRPQGSAAMLWGCISYLACPPDPVLILPEAAPTVVSDVACHGQTYEVTGPENWEIGSWITSYDFTCESGGAHRGTCKTIAATPRLRRVRLEPLRDVRVRRGVRGRRRALRVVTVVTPVTSPSARPLCPWPTG